MMANQIENLPRYRARIFSPEKGLLIEERASSSLGVLNAQIESEGLTLISAELVDKGAMRGGRGHFPLLVFCQQLSSLLDAGLQLVVAVDTLAGNERDSGHRLVLQKLRASLHSGLSFSQSLAVYPEIFPPLFHASIEASEQTGGVASALKRFVAYEGQFQALRSRLIGALIYPALLLSLGGLVVAFLLSYVVPRFSVVFADRLQEMPYLSRAIVMLGLSIAENPWVSLGLSSAALIGLFVLGIHPVVRSWMIGVATEMPWLGQRIQAFELVRMYRSLGMLLQGGIPAVRSLQMISPIVPLRSRKRIFDVIQAVSEGRPISEAMRSGGFTTLVSERLLAVGESSGNMGEMLERASDFLDAELERSVDRAVRLLEPIMMVIMGGVIGGIVMLMYLPIFELAESVK
jgi:general secretion pathway protein F